jgi:hypothetical protein
VYAALLHVGEAYVFAAEGPDQFDCSGLTRMAWKTAGVDLVHYAITQREQTIDVPADALRPGDLVFRFQQPGGHVMIYLGVGDLIVQAGGTSTGVTVGSWGHTDGFGAPLGPAPATAPLTADGAEPAAADLPTPVWFGPGAANTTVVADIPHAAEFNAAGQRANVAPALLAAIAALSTGFRTDPPTGSHAVGMMGLAPPVAAELGVDPVQPGAAIEGAALRLSAMAARLSDPAASIAAYRSRWRLVSDASLVPQDEDTKRFVAAVLAVAHAYATPNAG